MPYDITLQRERSGSSKSVPQHKIGIWLTNAVAWQDRGGAGYT